MTSQREWLLARFDFYRCPNSDERTLHFAKDSHDDKVMCDCGQTNPIVKERGYTEPMTDGWVHHWVRDLSPVSVDEHIAWVEKLAELIRTRRGGVR